MRSLSRNKKDEILKLLASLFSINQKINFACIIVVFLKFMESFRSETFWLVIDFRYVCFLLYVLTKLRTPVLSFVTCWRAFVAITNSTLPESILQITKINSYSYFWHFLTNYFKITWYVIWNLILVYQKRNF